MSSIKIAVFGDSVAAGTSSKLDVFFDCFQYGTKTVNMVRETQTWYSILGRILSDWIENGTEVIDAGIAGDNSSKALARLENDVLSHSPDYVLVMFGSDDTLAGTRLESFKQDIKKIISRIKDKNSQAILVTPAPISEKMTATGCSIYELRQRQDLLSDMVQIIRDIATGGSHPLIDLHKYFLDNRLAYDHLYKGWLPDAVAQSGMASFIAGELLPLLGINNYPGPMLCGYSKVYSDAEHPEAAHHAFSDIACFRGEFFLTFRKGRSHGNPKSTTEKSQGIIVLRSTDGIVWSEDSFLKVEGMDNRDPKFLITRDNRLILFNVCVRINNLPDKSNIITYGYERIGPNQWSDAFECGQCVFWRPKPWRDQYVVAVYLWPDEKVAVKLLSSKDGRNWKPASDILARETDGNETDLYAEEEKLVAYSRAGAGSNEETLISTYMPAENRWETVSTGRLIHAPNVFKVEEQTMVSGRYCAQTDERFRELREDWRKFTTGDASESANVDPAHVEEYHHGLRTGIFLMDGTRPRLLMELLSAGDSSYTGTVRYGDEYLMSDYSMHEYYPTIRKPGDWNTPCDIYVSRIRFKKSR